MVVVGSAVRVVSRVFPVGVGETGVRVPSAVSFRVAFAETSGEGLVVMEDGGGSKRREFDETLGSPVVVRIGAGRPRTHWIGASGA